MTERSQANTLERIAAADEVEIETHRARDGRARRTVIWAVVDGGRVYVRAIRGAAGLWYRELHADPAPALWVGGERVPVRPVQVADAAEIERVSDAYRRKYGRSPYLGGVLEPHTLGATTRLELA
ncbi:MAG TPA: nitroreductase/quinone reductase family protein [Chloroflexota bacterium]|jgi:hypothetical protein|nr:nitroreductase/quinone reductase family protein [Chloroflexota bacterium]